MTTTSIELGPYEVDVDLSYAELDDLRRNPGSRLAIDAADTLDLLDDVTFLRSERYDDNAIANRIGMTHSALL